MPIDIAPNRLPKTSEWLFPEYDFDRMNPEEYAGVVIERILERGTWGQVNWLFDYYGEEKLTAWVREHGFRLLSSRSFALWRLVLNVKDFVAPEWAVKERSRPRRPAAAPPRMKMYIPLRRRGAGVGCPEPKDPPRTLTPSAPPERGFSGEELPMVTFYLEAVTPACQQALKLSRDQPLLSGYYLAGGTALALQIGHRISTDLDWFSSSHCLESQEREALRFALNQTGSFEVVREQDGQIYGRLAGADVSFIYQPHPLVEPAIPYEGVSLASPTDIGLMKLAAINSRGTRRDFVDLYCLRSFISIDRLVELAEVKYADRPAFLDITARALAYFADAEQQPMPRLLWNDVKWKDIVEYCEASAKWLTQRMRERHR